MDIAAEIIKLFQQIGIPIVLVILVAAGVMIYKNLLDIQLTNLNIQQAKRDLAV
jgi:hypothetical protein